MNQRNEDQRESRAGNTGPSGHQQDQQSRLPHDQPGQRQGQHGGQYGQRPYGHGESQYGQSPSAARQEGYGGGWDQGFTAWDQGEDAMGPAGGPRGYGREAQGYGRAARGYEHEGWDYRGRDYSRGPRQYRRPPWEEGYRQGPRRFDDDQYARDRWYEDDRFERDRSFGRRNMRDRWHEEAPYGREPWFDDSYRRGQGYSRFARPPFAQQPSGHAPFSHAAFGESNEPHYFGTGTQGYGGGPSFTGGTYGMSDKRSDSPYFQEVGFNRGYYEDPFAGEPEGPRGYPYPRAFAEARPVQRRRYPMGPKGYQRSDERLREDICERLMEAYHIDSSEVTVRVLGCKVILEGTVPERRMKHAIEDLAAAAPGVQDVENRVRVAGQGSATQGSSESGAPEVDRGQQH